MSHYVETFVSSRKRTRESIRVESLIPSELRVRAAKLISLLEDYYTHMNEAGQPSYAVSGMTQARDIDLAGEKFLDMIQREVAVTVPKKLTADKIKLYKNLMKYYSIRGSEESIALFFRILFNDEVEVYYPQESVLIPSSGTWDQTGRRPVYDQTGALTGYENGLYTSNRGFLSDTGRLQDSYFYQKFSYVIRTGNNVSRWKDSFNRLVHPAGFIFFGEILIVLELLNGHSAMPGAQPGLISNEDLPLLVLAEIVSGSTYLWTIEDGSTALLPQFIDGETVTGQTSGAAGRVSYYDIGKNYFDGTSYHDRGSMFLDAVSGGPFLVGETLVGSKSGSSRVISSAWSGLPAATASIAEDRLALLVDSFSTNSQYWSIRDRYMPLLKFFDPTPMYRYADVTVDEAINNSIAWSPVASDVTIH